MSLLPKPSKVVKRAPKKSKRGGSVVKEGTVEPLAGWTVGFAIIEDKNKTTDHNPDGRFVRFTSGMSWQPDKSLGTAMAYAAVIDALRD
jgi:hypothetical protein